VPQRPNARSTRAAAETTAFGQVLRDARLRKGLTQEQLSFLAGRHDTYVRRLEQGSSSPTLETLFALAKALDISPSTLVRRVEQITDQRER